MGLIESIRKWIDGDTNADLLEEADEHAKPRRIWEEFLVKIAREVEAAMQRADRALYAAKAEGRNRVECAEPPVRVLPASRRVGRS